MKGGALDFLPEFKFSLSKEGGRSYYSTVFSSEDPVSKLELTKARKDIHERQGKAGQVLNTARFPLVVEL